MLLLEFPSCLATAQLFIAGKMRVRSAAQAESIR